MIQNYDPLILEILNTYNRYSLLGKKCLILHDFLFRYLQNKPTPNLASLSDYLKYTYQNNLS